MAGKTPYKVGQIFGFKELTEYCGSDPKFRVSLWKYRCTLCGTEHGPVRTATITRRNASGVPKCCQYKHYTHDKSPSWKGYKELTGAFLGMCRYGAQKRGYEWSVTPEYLWRLWLDQDGRCWYSGRKLTHGVDASLDRTDSNIGYVEGNVRWVHRDVNRMKTDFSEKDFLSLCKDIARSPQHSVVVLG